VSIPPNLVKSTSYFPLLFITKPPKPIFLELPCELPSTSNFTNPLSCPHQEIVISCLWLIIGMAKALQRLSFLPQNPTLTCIIITIYNNVFAPSDPSYTRKKNERIITKTHISTSFHHIKVPKIMSINKTQLCLPIPGEETVPQAIQSSLLLLVASTMNRRVSNVRFISKQVRGKTIMDNLSKYHAYFIRSL